MMSTLSPARQAFITPDRGKQDRRTIGLQALHAATKKLVETRACMVNSSQKSRKRSSLPYESAVMYYRFGILVSAKCVEERVRG